MRLNLVSLFLQRQRYLAALPYLRGNVLDLGCNTGQILECLKPGQQYVGVDSSSGVAAWWQRTRPGVEFHLRNLDCDALGRQLDDARTVYARDGVTILQLESRVR